MEKEVNCRVSLPEGLSAKAKDVHTELVHVLKSDAIAYSTMTKYIRNDVIFQNEPEAKDGVEDQGFSIPDNVNLEAFEMMPFAPIRQIAEMTSSLLNLYFAA
jgi:hypothetical protein